MEKQESLRRRKGSAEDKDYAETDDRNFLADQIAQVISLPGKQTETV